MDQGALKPWLLLVTKGHFEPQRVTQHILDVLTKYPTLRPKYDYYTYPSGERAPTLCTFGTLPVKFQGTVYQFPVSLWYPVQYPEKPPIVQVVPTSNMVVSPGKCVDATGIVQHPYLRQWDTQPGNTTRTVVEVLTALQAVFASEPPVRMK
ncbi:suppressor protein stp22 of temperature-sensitive alpha-factor receptor and arginine permease, partial [Dispira parvispora]